MVAQYDEQLVDNLFEVVGSQRETIFQLKRYIEDQDLAIQHLRSSNAAEAIQAVDVEKKASEPFFKCAENIRVRKYELELRRPDETKVQLDNLAAHQGCVVVDAYQFVQRVLDSKKHLQTFNKWYGDVAPETVWEGRGCEKFIKMLNWRCGMYDFTGSDYEASEFALNFDVVMEDNKGKTGAEFEEYLTQNPTGVKAMETMEIKFGFELLAHRNPNYPKSRRSNASWDN